jgi:hypothetical protein
MSKVPPFDRVAENEAEAWRQQYRKGGWRKAKRCDYCYGFYYPRQGNQRFCSRKCQDAWWWERRKVKETARRRARQQKKAAEKAAQTSV